jgi:hypothetical protein
MPTTSAMSSPPARPPGTPSTSWCRPHQGELQTMGWLAANPGDVLCSSDRNRTGHHSRLPGSTGPSTPTCHGTVQPWPPPDQQNYKAQAKRQQPSPLTCLLMTTFWLPWPLKIPWAPNSSIACAALHGIRSIFLSPTVTVWPCGQQGPHIAEEAGQR